MATPEFGTISATRMELLNTRARIRLAQKGHDLLKEKMDALVIELYAIKDEVRQARKQVEEELLIAYQSLAKAEMILGPDRIRDLALYAPAILEIKTQTVSIMGVRSPRFVIDEIQTDDEEVFYGLSSSSAQLDRSIVFFRKSLKTLMIVAEKMTLLEKLALEINKTKRRVNALNYILIPKLKATAKFIASTLEEQERETFSRLKRVKAILEAKKA
ncbi:MAG: V-type ATP synthase subunit D [Candidatus Heimdallarchaeota archaeon]|nr:V-type ATP synthase subunit D [Candidatus Heimdallarchaeota archaeon]MCK4769868.1 V-type ATP synthase subunit D [Candidatus Heimdallarchaeota archaeon]